MDEAEGVLGAIDYRNSWILGRSGQDWSISILADSFGELCDDIRVIPG